MRFATSMAFLIQIKQSCSLIFFTQPNFCAQTECNGDLPNVMGIFHSCNDIDSIITKYAKNLIDNWWNFVGSLPCDMTMSQLKTVLIFTKFTE